MTRAGDKRVLISAGDKRLNVTLTTTASGRAGAGRQEDDWLPSGDPPT